MVISLLKFAFVCGGFSFYVVDVVGCLGVSCRDGAVSSNLYIDALTQSVQCGFRLKLPKFKDSYKFDKARYYPLCIIRAATSQHLDFGLKSHTIVSAVFLDVSDSGRGLQTSIVFSLDSCEDYVWMMNGLYIRLLFRGVGSLKLCKYEVA